MLLFEGQKAQEGDEFFSTVTAEWHKLPPWTWGAPVSLDLWGCVRRI